MESGLTDVPCWLAPLAAALTGWLLWSRLPADPGEADDQLERIGAVALSGLFVTGMAALLLAEFGHLRPWTLLAALFVLAAVLWRLPRRSGPATRTPRLTIAAFLFVALLGAVTTAPASEDLLGGRDGGVYASTAGWVAREGTLVIRSGPLGTLAAEARPVFVGSVIGPGFYVGEPASGELYAQFLHLLPVYMALGDWLSGPSAAFLVPPLLGVLAELAVFLFVRRMLGPGPALLAATLLALNLAQIWGMRNPYSEGLTQLGVFAALWGIARGSATGGVRWGTLAALSLGACFLTRIDTGLLLAALAPAVVVVCVSKPMDPRWITAALLPLALGLAAWSLAHGWFFSRPYLRDLAPLVIPLWTFAAVVTAISLAAVARRRSLLPLLERIHERGRFVWALAAAGLCAAFVFGLWVRPHLEPFAVSARSGNRFYDEDTLVRVGWYLSSPGMVGGLGGVLLLLRRWVVQRHTEWVPFLSVFLGFSLLYFWKMQIAPDHPWAMRRYLPVVLPGICVALAAAAAWLWARPRPWRVVARLTAVAVMGAVLVHEVRIAWPYRAFVEKAGLTRQLTRIAARVPAAAIMLNDYPGGAESLAMPLAIYFGRDALPVLRNTTADPRGEGRRPQFESQVLRWLRGGREVLYLTSDDGRSTFLTHALRWEERPSVDVEYPTVGEHFNTPPWPVQRRSLRYRLLRAVPTAATPALCTDSSWDANQPLLLRAQGFYLSERNDHGRFRWTMPESRFVFPACDRTGSRRPSLVRIGAACGRDPSGGDCIVYVQINGHEAGVLRLTRRLRDYEVRIPAAALDDAVGPIEIEFRGPEYIADPSQRRERRLLSFQIVRIAVD